MHRILLLIFFPICLGLSYYNGEDKTLEDIAPLRGGYRDSVSTDVVSTAPPYHVSLINLDTENLETYFLCSGALISPKLVLTSANCMRRVLEDEIVVAVVGKTTFDPNNPDTYYSTEKYIQYDTGSVNDIAILPLQKAVDLVNGEREIIPLPDSNKNRRNTKRAYTRLEGQLSGWGLPYMTNFTNENTSDVVKVTKHWIPNQKKCNSWIKRHLPFVEGSLICTQPDNYANCIGNYGSPLVGTPRKETKEVIIGLARFNMKSCKDDPIIYIFIPHYVSWIKTAIASLT